MCPECGGRVSPFGMFRVRPTDTIRCRWCNSELNISRTVRVIVDVLLVAGGAAAVSWFGTLFIDSGDSLPLLYLAASLVGLTLLLLIVGAVLELDTHVPRDHRDWDSTHEHDSDDDPAASLSLNSRESQP